ncbi:MAG: hypothetical protein HQK49_12725 [Oligoflexia bacterium]|nr:hypothetical protein [Oligoflexia bacterium]
MRTPQVPRHKWVIIRLILFVIIFSSSSIIINKNVWGDAFIEPFVSLSTSGSAETQIQVVSG